MYIFPQTFKQGPSNPDIFVNNKAVGYDKQKCKVGCQADRVPTAGPKRSLPMTIITMRILCLFLKEVYFCLKFLITPHIEGKLFMVA